MGGILKSTTLPSSRQCRDEVPRKRAWGKSRLEMLLFLPLLPTILLLLPHTAASPERASHALAHLLSSQSPFLLFPWTKAPRKHFSQNRQKSGAHQSRTKREIGQLNSKPLQQWSKQGERPPYFLPIPKLASNSIDFLVRPLDGINSFQISHPPPLPLPSSLRRALRWPPWPPDPHSAQMVPFPTKAGRGGAKVWPGGSTRSTRSTKARWGGAKVWPGKSTTSARKRMSTMAHLEPGTTKAHSRDYRRAIVDQSPEQVGKPPPKNANPATPEKARTQGGKTRSPLYAALPGRRTASPCSVPRTLLIRKAD